jgi:WD40 repeat protein
VSPDDPRPTVPRIPPAPEATVAHVPADDTGARAAGESSADPARTAPGPPSDTPAAGGTVARTPSDTDRQEREAQTRAAAGVPGYVLTRELGRGGMGVVYEARHLKLNRVVALKMMLGGGQAGRGELIRFLAEAEAIAAVEHENVVQVYDYGESDGRPFMALEFCAGGTLGKLLPKAPGTAAAPRATAVLIAKVARGVAAAHALGIVHRDLKPGNVLLDEAGVPKVADFGLAKRGDGSEVTQTGQVMGTPAYMSPEQAKGETKFVGPQADVWALGVMLYEALAGQRPFQGSVQEVLAAVQNAEPVPPRARAPALPRDLELICLKCLAKHPHERYPTAKELADDLERAVAGEPVSVRSPGPAERVVKWARRKPTLAAVYALGLLSAVLASTGAAVAWYWQEAVGARDREVVARGEAEVARRQEEDARGQAEAQRRNAVTARDAETTQRGIAERERDRADRLAAGRAVDVAVHEIRGGRLNAARALLDSVPQRYRKWEWDHVQWRANPERATLRGLTGIVQTAQFGAGGRMVIGGDQYGQALVFDLDPGGEPVRLGAGSPEAVKDKTGKEVGTFVRAHAAFMTAAAVNPAGTLAVTAGGDGFLKTWELPTGKPAKAVASGRRIWQLRFSPDGKVLAAADQGGYVALLDPATLEFRRRLEGPTRTVNCLAFDPAGARLAAAGADRAVFVWDVRTGALLVNHPEHADEIGAVNFSPDGKRLLTVDTQGGIAGWRADTGEPLFYRFLRQLLEAGIHCTAVSPTGQEVLIASRDVTPEKWELAPPTAADVAINTVAVFGHARDAHVTRADYAPDGATLLTADTAGTIKVWAARPDGVRLVFPRTFEDGDPFRGAGSARQFAGFERAPLDFRPDGGAVLAVDDRGDLYPALPYYPGEGPAPRGNRPPARRVVLPTGLGGAAFALAPGGAFAATVRGDRVRVVDTRTDAEVASFPAAGARPAKSWSLSRDGSRLLALLAEEKDRTARLVLWDARTGAVLAERPASDPTYASVAAVLSPDGRQIAAAFRNKTPDGPDPKQSIYGPNTNTGYVRVLDAATGQRLREWQAHSQNINDLCYSPDGSRLATTSGLSGTALWDPETGDRCLALEANGQGVRFSPDGRQLAVRSHAFVYLWDAAAPRPEGK